MNERLQTIPTSITTIRKDDFIQFVKFNLWGSLGSISELFIFTVLITYFGVDYISSTILSYIVKIFFGFILNSKYTFPTVKDQKVYFIMTKYFLVNLTGLLLNVLLVYLLVESVLLKQFESVETIAKIIAIILDAVLTFFLHKKITFKQAAVENQA